MIINKIKRIKYSRLSDIDKYFLKLIKGIERIKDDDNKYYWIQNKHILFEERIKQKIIFFSRPLWIRLNNKYSSKSDVDILLKLCHNHMVTKDYTIIINTDRGEETWDIIEQKYDR